MLKCDRLDRFAISDRDHDRDSKFQIAIDCSGRAPFTPDLPLFPLQLFTISNRDHDRD
jgi:hypothetical protein